MMHKVSGRSYTFGELRLLCYRVFATGSCVIFLIEVIVVTMYLYDATVKADKSVSFLLFTRILLMVP